MGTDYQYIGWGADDGMVVGNAGESIGFLGATPTTVAPITSVAITTASTTTASYGATSAAEFNNVCEIVRRIRAQMIALGFMEESVS